jgi:hypothetical protein
VKAAHLTAPMRIELVDAPIPRAPDDGILLAVKACGV